MNSPAIRPANFTRHTPDLAGKLRSERRYGFLALYHVMRLSDFGREGIERSGSYRFAVKQLALCQPLNSVPKGVAVF